MTGHAIDSGENSASDLSKENFDEGSSSSSDISNDSEIINTTENITETKKSGGGGGSGGGSDDEEEKCISIYDTPGEITCTVDSDCEDCNFLTIDRCKDSIIDFDNETNTTIYGKECVNIIPNFYGTIYDTDENDTGIEGVNISFYDSSEYDPYEDDGDYEGLEPFEDPNATTDENGIYGMFLDPDEEYHMVMQHSDEKEFNINVRKNASQEIITETEGYIKVFFEKASASLKSDLYINSPVEDLLIENSNVGETVYVNNQTVYSSGTELEFNILVHGTSWGIGEYNHSSDSKYCQIERLDKDTWRLHFEDLPDSWPPDWDFNDAVVLVDIVGNVSNETSYDEDCDEDGIVNWLDDNDSDCDFGEEDQEIDEDNDGNFNAEGHILYHGKYGSNNKYVCGDKLKFMMFGINKRDTNETITFMIEDHTINHGVNGISVYNGSIFNEDENLFVPNNGTKVHEIFDFEIPCNFSTSGNGKHDIHIIWNGEKFHKIGNFFVIEDTTNPEINTWGENSGLPGEPITIEYSAFDNPQPGTIRALDLGILEGPDDTLVVEIDKDKNGSIDYSVTGGNSEINLTYNQSGNYTARFTVTDGTGNSDYEDVDIVVYITEEEADAIAYPLYEEFGLIILGDFYNDTNRSIESSSPDVFMNIDMYNTNREVGHEYMTTNNNVHSEDDSNSEEEQIGGLNAVISGCSGPEYVKPINPSTEAEFNNILRQYFEGLCSCPINPIPICP